LGVSSESDIDARQHFFTVNDLSDLWNKFVIENNAVLNVLVELGKVQYFSSSEELEANRMLVSAKALVIRFSLLIIDEKHRVAKSGSPSNAAFNSKTTTK